MSKELFIYNFYCNPSLANNINKDEVINVLNRFQQIYK
jgi:hypothetical protein